jgi:TRAP-type C4-dicarboxylate transport system permease small subunit
MRFRTIDDRARTTLALVVTACLFVMMLLTVVDVAGRKLLGTPLPGSVELTEIMMLGVLYAGLPLASLEREHVLFDLLDHVLSERLMALQDMVANLLCAALLGAAAWLVFVRAGRTAELGDTTAQLAIPLSGLQYAISCLLVIAAIYHLRLAIGRDAKESES